MKVVVDKDNPHVQIYGKYRYNTELEEGGILSSVSKRKDYPDILSKKRPEKCIKTAIKNYNAELDEKINKIHQQYV